MLPPAFKELNERHGRRLFSWSFITDFIDGEYTDKDLFLDNLSEFRSQLIREEGLNLEELELLKKLTFIDFDKLIQEFDRREVFHIYDPPIHDPARFLEFLKWLHSPRGLEQWKRLGFASQLKFYDYSGITPDMIPKALASIQHEHDPLHFGATQLSPQQILDSQRADSEKDRAILTLKKFIGDRMDRLRKNRELMDIISGDRNLYIHATTDRETAEKIMRGGLFFSDLGGSVVGLYRSGIISASRESNLRTLVRSHGGYSYQVIIEFPKLTIQQLRIFYQRYKRDRGLFFGKKLERKVVIPGPRGAIREFDKVLEPKFILGYVDLNNGQLVKNPKFNPVVS